MINIRCSKCTTFYSIRNTCCPKCKNAKERIFYVRYKGKSTYVGDTLSIAREIDLRMKRESKLQHIKEYDIKKVPTYSEFVDNSFIPHYIAKNKRYNDVSSKVEYFRLYLGDKPLDKILSSEIEALVNKISQQRSPRTRDYYLSTIRRIFNYAIELDIIDKNPVKVKELKVDNARLRYLTHDEQERLIFECSTSRTKELLPMVMIALYTGMRLGEIQALNEHNIIGESIKLYGTQTKNKRTRMIPIHDKIKKYLILPFNYNVRIDGSFNNALTRAKITDFTFHDLRHTFASRLVSQGVSLYTVGELLGHTSTEMTRRYSHLAPDSALKAIDLL